MRLARYREKDWQFSFYNSSNQAEVDLVIETPQGKVYAIEIKANDAPHTTDLRGLRSFLEICPKAQALCASLAPHRRVIDGIEILPWQEAIAKPCRWLGIGVFETQLSVEGSNTYVKL